MRKALLLVPMMTLLLCACSSGQEDDPFQILQERFQAVTAAQAEAELTCSYGDEVRTYSLTCSYTPENSRVEVTAPEQVAGIAAEWDAGTLTLSYDDVMLDAGPYADTEMSPMWAVPALIKAMAEGYPLEMGEEDLGETPCFRITYETGRGQEQLLYHTVWFTQEGTPVRGEISGEDGVIYIIEFQSFTSEETEEHGTDAETDLGGD